MGFEVGDTAKLESQYERLNNQLIRLKKNQADLNKTDLNNVKKSIDETGKSVTNVIKKMGRWALAVFAVESAYGFVRSSISTLSGYNEQLAADIEYIQFAMASALEPVIETIVSWVYKLLQYVNYLADAWFGINLFAGATADAMNKTASSAEKVRKSTAGFDEMNVISSSSSTASSSSATLPSMDLSNLEDVEIPSWLEWIGSHGKEIAIAIGLVVGSLLGVKALSFLGKSSKDVKNFSSSLSGLLNGLGKAATAIAILGGIALVLSQLDDLIRTFSESGLSLSDVAILLGSVLGELAIAFTVMAAASKLMDWSGIAGAAVILAGFALVLSQVTNLISVFSTSGMTLNDVIGLMATVLVTIIALMGSVAVLGPAMTAGLLPFSVLIAGISATLLVMAATLPTILEATSDFIVATAPSLIAVLTTIGDIIEQIIYALGTVMPPIIESVGSLFDTVFKGIANVVSTVGNTIIDILEAAGKLVESVLGSILKFIKELGPAVETFVDSMIRSVTKLVNFIISAIEYLVNTLIIGGVNNIIKAINSISKYVGIEIGLVPEMEIPRFTPKLKSGGIINLPGKGVPLGGHQAIGGEAGAEGVIPLTDRQAMEQLGSTIGRYVTINLTNNTNLDGRLIQRKQSQLTANKNFAMNR